MLTAPLLWAQAKVLTTGIATAEHVHLVPCCRAAKARSARRSTDKKSSGAVHPRALIGSIRSLARIQTNDTLAGTSRERHADFVHVCRPDVFLVVRGALATAAPFRRHGVDLAGRARRRPVDALVRARLQNCRVQGTEFRVQGVGFRVQGSGFRV